MATLAVLGVLSLMACATRAGTTCQGDGQVLTLFNGQAEDIEMPCKIHAVKQKCGKYFVNMSPGSIYQYPNFHVDSFWLGLRDRETKEEWEANSDNGNVLKFLDGTKDVFFNKKDGSLDTDSVVNFGKDSHSAWVEAKNGDFKLTITPRDVANADSRTSWVFQCNAEMEASEFPNQVCGGVDANAISSRATELELESNQQAIFYDVFNKTEIKQTKSQCVEATRQMTEVCNEELRRKAIRTCTSILAGAKSANCNCVSDNSCNPMDLFVDCITWACSGFTDADSCGRLGMFTLSVNN